MKKYIFFSSCDIHDMGGLPLYYLGKAKYLEENGWKVFVFFPGKNTPDCAISQLNKYVNDNLTWPEDNWRNSKDYINDYINLLVDRIGKRKFGDEIIIETYDYWTSPWVELLAKKLKAKHIIVLLNECKESDINSFRDDVDFYLFKYKRHEFFGNFNIQRAIFEGYLPLNNDEDHIPFLIDEDPVQNVNNPIIDSISHDDWNIAYIGRTNKMYLPNIIEGVCEFAKNHNNHQIQFIVLGDFNCCKELYSEKSAGIDNLLLVELGDQFPIPKNFFKKLDVVIAGAGSARCSVYEGVPTLLADAANYMCNGLLGYETIQSGYADADTNQGSFSDGLERALVQKVHLNKRNVFPPKVGVEDCCKQNFKVIYDSSKRKKYYNLNTIIKKCDDPFFVRIKSRIKRIMYHCCPHILERYDKRKVEKRKNDFI